MTDTYLAFVTHDTKTNTLEATWIEPLKDLDGNLKELRRVKCRNYSVEQKAEFLSDCGAGSEKYTTMAGW
jgi:hypothetical protein